MKFRFDRSHLLTISVTAAVLSAGAWAQPVTIDFEDVGVFNIFALPTISSRGFTFHSNTVPGLGTLFNGEFCAPACAANGTTTLAVSGFGAVVGGGGSSSQPIVFENGAGLPFRLIALDIAELTNTPDHNADRIALTGYVLGGGTLLQTVLLDTLNDGPGGSADFERAALDPAWRGVILTSIEFRGMRGPNSFFNEAFSLDNVQVEVVSEPSVLGLLAVAMSAAFGLRARRRLRLLRRSSAPSMRVDLGRPTNCARRATGATCLLKPTNTSTERSLLASPSALQRARHVNYEQSH